MRTSVRRGSGSRSRSTSGGSRVTMGRPGPSRVGRTTGSSKRGAARKTKRSSTAGAVSKAYKCCNTSFSNKIRSYRTLCGQTTGPGKACRPSPTTLNSLANWIDKGAVIQTVTTAQVRRWAKGTRKNVSSQTPTSTTCKNILCGKFGKSTIKAVSRTKSGSYMVATAPVVKGKPFCFPK